MHLLSLIKYALTKMDVHQIPYCFPASKIGHTYDIGFIRIDTNSIVRVKGVIRFNSYSRTKDENCIYELFDFYTNYDTNYDTNLIPF